MRHIIIVNIALLLRCAVLYSDDVARPSETTSQAAAGYDAIFGAEETRVVASHNTKEAARFAGKLATAVQSLSDDPNLFTIVNEKIYAFGIKDPEGYEAALAAVKRLAEADPARVDQSRIRELEIYRLQFKRGGPKDRASAGTRLLDLMVTDAETLESKRDFAGAIKSYKEAQQFSAETRSARADEISARLRCVTAKKAVVEKIERIAAKPGAAFDAAAAREMMTLAVADLDDPELAERYATDRKDREMLSLAKSKAVDISEPKLVELGAWYRATGSRASSAGKIVALAHAYDLYDAYTAAHKAHDGDRVVAEMAKADLIKSLTALGAGTADQVVVWNGHDGSVGDRGASKLNVVLLRNGQQVWRRDDIEIPWAPQKSLSVAVRLPPLVFNVVRLEITDWHIYGASLSEVEVFKNGRNIGLGCRTKVSGTNALHKDLHGAQLTDGVEEGKTPNDSWSPPDRGPSWAEIEIGVPNSASATQAGAR